MTSTWKGGAPLISSLGALGLMQIQTPALFSCWCICYIAAFAAWSVKGSQPSGFGGLSESDET